MTNQTLPVIQYQCPGETGVITKAVHLARLASGHATCERCEHRFDSALLPKHIVRRLNSPLVPNHNIFTNHGIRGAYLNQITRNSISTLAQHILTLIEPSTDSQKLPRIVVGHDARDCSPDIVIGVVSTLKSWGCDVADFSLISRPAFDFSVQHVKPDLGIYVTGGSAPNNWCGLDILDTNAHPWTMPGKLQELQEQTHKEIKRPRRCIGKYQMLFSGEAYARSIAEAFNPIRQYRIAVASGDPLTLNLLSSVFEQSRCTLHPVPLNFAMKTDLRERRFKEEILHRRVDVGIIIEPDALALHLFDETGTGISHEVVEQFLNGQRNADHTVALQRNIPLVTDSQGRYWFQNQTPECDALLTLARLLKQFWHADSPVSKL